MSSETYNPLEGTGQDEFLFSKGDGKDVLADFFNFDGDIIDLRAFGLGTFGNLLAHTVDIAAGAYIDLGGGDSITINGVFESQLLASDFIL